MSLGLRKVSVPIFFLCFYVALVYFEITSTEDSTGYSKLGKQSDLDVTQYGRSRSLSSKIATAGLGLMIKKWEGIQESNDTIQFIPDKSNMIEKKNNNKSRNPNDWSGNGNENEYANTNANGGNENETENRNQDERENQNKNGSENENANTNKDENRNLDANENKNANGNLTKEDKKNYHAKIGNLVKKNGKNIHAIYRNGNRGNENSSIFSSIAPLDKVGIPPEYFNISLIIPATLDSFPLSVNLLESILYQSVYPKEILILISDLYQLKDTDNLGKKMAFHDLQNKWETSLSGPCPYNPNFNLNIKIIFLLEGKIMYQNNARNKLVEQVTYPYVSAFDIDDVMHPRRIELQQKVFESDSQIDAIVADYVHTKRTDFNKNPSAIIKKYLGVNSLASYDLSIPPVQADNPFCQYFEAHNTTLLKKIHLDELEGGKDPDPYCKLSTTPKTSTSVPFSDTVSTITIDRKALYYIPHTISLFLNTMGPPARSVKKTIEFIKAPDQYLKVHNGWSAMKTGVWKAHPQCPKWYKPDCSRKEDLQQIMEIVSISSLKLVILPVELGLYITKG